MKIQELNQQIFECKRCKLHDLEFNIQNINKGTGKLIGYYSRNLSKKYMFVGLNPSYRRFPGIYQAFGGEVKSAGSGDIFVGWLKELDVLKDSYITNIQKCSTETNTVNTHEIDICFPFLQEEIELVKPKIIISLGNKVHEYLTSYGINTAKIPHPSFIISYNGMTPDKYKQIIQKVLDTS